MRNKIWNKLDQKAWSNRKKQRSFLVCYMLFCAFCGAAAWFLAGQWLIPTADGQLAAQGSSFLPGPAMSAGAWLLCFMGYPAFFVGLLGGVIYLYRK